MLQMLLLWLLLRRSRGSMLILIRPSFFDGEPDQTASSRGAKNGEFFPCEASGAVLVQSPEELRARRLIPPRYCTRRILFPLLLHIIIQKLQHS